MLNSLLFFLLGFIYSYYFYKASKKKYELSVFLDSDPKDNDTYYLYIWNSGNKTLYPTDILNESESINIFFDDPGVVYAVIEQVTNEYLNINLKHHYTYMNINFDLLRPDDGFSVLIKPLCKMYWDLEIKHQKNILIFQKTIREKSTNSNLELISNIVSFLVLCLMPVSLIINGDINLNSLNTIKDYMNITFFLIISIIILIGIPRFLRIIRSRRPPKELKIHSLPSKYK